MHPELVQTLIDRVALLAQHGIKFVYRVLIRVIPLETIVLLEITTWQLGVAALSPDRYLSCTAFSTTCSQVSKPALCVAS